MTEQKKQPEQTNFTVKIDKDLAKAFSQIAKENDRNGASLVREFIKNYVKKHGQGSLF